MKLYIVKPIILEHIYLFETKDGLPVFNSRSIILTRLTNITKFYTRKENVYSLSETSSFNFRLILFNIMLLCFENEKILNKYTI